MRGKFGESDLGFQIKLTALDTFDQVICENGTKCRKFPRIQLPVMYETTLTIAKNHFKMSQKVMFCANSDQVFLRNKTKYIEN